jgi:hypothetical protein
VKALISYVIGFIIFIGISIVWLPWVIWFLPLVIVILYIAVLKPSWHSQWFLFLICIGGICTGLWAILLLIVIGPNLPPLIQNFLTLHINEYSEPIFIGRYLIGGMSSGEFLGYIALISIGGFVLLFILMAMNIISKVQDRSRRIWLFRFSVVIIVGGGTLLVYFFAKEYWILFGFISYMVSIGFLTNKVDPLEELKD